MRKFLLLILLCFSQYLISQMPNEDNILFVNKNQETGNNSGDSWENAIPELADALKWARENQNSGTWSANDPLQIWVVEGTYKPLYNAADGQYTENGDRDNTFVMVKNVQIYGGFSGIETSLEERDWQSNQTILSGNIGNENSSNDNSYHIVIAAGNLQQALLDGFTLTEGRGDGSIFGGPVVNGYEINEGGGAINTRSTSILFQNLIVDNNLGYWGGQIYNYQGSPRFENIEITNGWSFWGGGMHNRGSNPVLKNVYFANNYGDLAGGGMYNVEYGLPNLENVTFFGNTTGADGQGGGLYSYVKVNLKMNNVAFIDNNANVAGGGIGFVADGIQYQDIIFKNCLFVGNTTNGYGGGIMFFDAQNGGTTFKIENSTFYGNTAATGSSLGIWYDQQANGVPVEFNNSIVWNNTTSISGSANPTFVINNSLLQDENCPGNLDCNNVIYNTDPLFTDAENGDFSLTENSPAVNAGNNALFTGLNENTLDLAGNPRVYGYGQGGIIDIGAYEFQGGDISVSDFTQNEIKYYPNPIQRGEILNIIGTDENFGTISLYSLTGQLILQKSSSLDKIEIPGNIPTGIYILKYENKTKSKSVKLIVR